MTNIQVLKHHLDKRSLELLEAATDVSDDELLTTPEVAKWLGVSKQWLEIGRSRGWGAPFVKLSPRRVRYRRGDVRRWLEERAYRSTAEYARKPSSKLPSPPPVAQPLKRRRQRVFLYDDDKTATEGDMAK